MMPGALIRSGLIEAVNDLANKISDSGKITVEFDTEIEQRFDENVEIAVYRIVQEILNNMIRHSGADKITISMKLIGNDLDLVIADNGRSFDVNTIASSEGIGWKNIYSRVEILNGKIVVKSEKGIGTSVFLSVSLV
jgi:two-component system, NarL family, sensor kinase